MKKLFVGRKIYLLLVLIFLYAPIVLLIAQAFNKSTSLSVWGGFTLEWFAALTEAEDILEALKNTLAIALLATVFATILGTIASIALVNMRKKARSVIMGFSNIPLLNAEIVTGISFLLLFSMLGIALSFGTVLIAHIAFCVPYVVLSVMPKLKQLDNMTYEAALDLGAGPVTAFFKVIIPDILPGIISGALLSFTLSLDDFVITYFAKGRGFNTLSTLIYAETKRGIRPEIYALSTILFVVIFVALLAMNRPKKAVNNK
ncbi:MAG: ABC transporter permease [Lachnospiraceae bacterium]|nr:ABC transporter permease [Lachnospiraceae bacterium]